MLLDVWHWINANAPFFHGAFSVLVALMAVASMRRPLMIAATLMMADWLTWNLTQIWFGYGASTLLLPTEDAMYLGFMVWVWSCTGRLPALALVSYFFLVAIVAWVVFIANRQQTTFTCLLTANGIFFAQEAIIGGAGAWWTIRTRMAGSAGRRPLRSAVGARAHRLHDMHRAPRAP